MISIIVPIYNVEKYLPKCIESLMDQTYQDIEIILVDDGSSDHCNEICDQYALLDNRIVVVHKMNEGVSTARNAGLQKANGSYIGFVDPDDWVSPDMFQELVDAIEASNAGIAICGYNYVDEAGSIDRTREYHCAENEVISHLELLKRLSDMPPSVRQGVVNKLYRKSILGNRSFRTELRSAEDVLFNNEYFESVENAIIVHKPLYFNRVRSGSATHGGLGIQALAQSFVAHEKVYKTTVCAYPELKDHALAFLLDVLTLKYKEAKAKEQDSPINNDDQRCLKSMRRKIHEYGWRSIRNREVYWKTRIMYLLV